MKNFILLATTLLAFAPLSPALADTKSGNSSTGDIVWSARSTSEGGELYVSWSGGGTGAFVADLVGLGALDVHFSADDRWLFVGDGGSSLGTNVRLYKRSKGLNYKEVTDFDFDFALQRLALQAETGTEIKSSVLDKSFVKCIGWTRNGTQAVLQISGRGTYNGKKVVIEKFTCTFDPIERMFAAKGKR